MKEELTDFSLRRNDMLTLIVIPTDKKDKNVELLESFAGVANDVVFLKEGNLDYNIKVNTIWKIFMYEGEVFDKDLQKALPEYLQLGLDFDVFSIYKLSNTGYSICPRLFKNEVRMKSNSIEADEQGLVFNTILDGFILGL